MTDKRERGERSKREGGERNENGYRERGEGGREREKTGRKRDRMMKRGWKRVTVRKRGGIGMRRG